MLLCDPIGSRKRLPKTWWMTPPSIKGSINISLKCPLSEIESLMKHRQMHDCFYVSDNFHFEIRRSTSVQHVKCSKFSVTWLIRIRRRWIMNARVITFTTGNSNFMNNQIESEFSPDCGATTVSQSELQEFSGNLLREAMYDVKLSNITCQITHVFYSC